MVSRTKFILGLLSKSFENADSTTESLPIITKVESLSTQNDDSKTQTTKSEQPLDSHSPSDLKVKHTNGHRLRPAGHVTNRPKQNNISNIKTTHWNFLKLLQHCKAEIHNLLTYALMEHQKFEYNLVMDIAFIGTQPFTYVSKFIVLADDSQINDTMDVLMELIKLDLTSREEDHFWFSKEIQLYKLIVNTRNVPNRRGGYLSLPMDISNSKIILNIESYDDFSFKWAMLFAVTKRMYCDVTAINITKQMIPVNHAAMNINFSGLRFPLEVRQCLLFEQNNPCISVNVFGFEVNDANESHIYGPLYRTRNEKNIHVNLLYIEDVARSRSHYACILQLDKLLRKYQDRPSQYMCNTCLRFFVFEHTFYKHKSNKRNCDRPLSVDPLLKEEKDLR